MVSLDDYISNLPAAKPVLPLFHTCDLEGFTGILELRSIKTAKCEVFKKELVYFFYGRPSYRIKGAGMPTANSAYDPICFILDFEKTGVPGHIYPFDTGAFAAGIFKEFMHHKWQKETFALTPDLNTPGKVVTGFYEGRNEDYYFGKAGNKEIEPLKTQVKGYHGLLTASGDTKFDNRGSSVEVAYELSIPINKDNVVAIIFPRYLLDDSDAYSFLTSFAGQLLPYYTSSRETPSSYHAVVYHVAAEFLKSANFI